MRMICVLSPTSQLLGHVNLNECGNLQSHITIENLRRPKGSLPQSVAEGVSELTVQQCVLPVQEMRFQQQGQQDSFVYILAKTLPEWFWDAFATAKFIT